MSHEAGCEINHQGSSEEMEAASTVEIFNSSITFVGDGDSSSFGRVRDAMKEKFGSSYEVNKEECVGHVQKRLGTDLRKYENDMKSKKVSDGKSVGGKGRLN